MKTVLNYGEMLAVNVGPNGIEQERLQTDLAKRFLNVHEMISKEGNATNMGFLDLENTWAEVEHIEVLAQTYRKRFSAVVVIGMGGSSLGMQALCQALLGESWNLLDDVSRNHCPKIYFLDNLDPVSVRELLDRINVEETLFNVVSKSGSTAETLALYAVVEDFVTRAMGSDKACEHFLFTTDPSLGTLREIAQQRGIESLEVPPDIGGRFSVLSPASLFLASLVGLDVRSIIRGAENSKEHCRTPVLKDNKAGMISTLFHTADREQGRNVHVVMPYCDRLQNFSLWFQQLWSESLGKAQNLSGELVNAGPTLLTARGAMDQHSQLQLFTEGPEDKVILFLKLGDHSDDIEIPVENVNAEAFQSFKGRGLGELLKLEQQATVESLRIVGRPTMTLELDSLDEEVMGELLMLFMMATVYAGGLYKVNPWDQPGVELSKRLTFEFLDRGKIKNLDPQQSNSCWKLRNTSSD